MAASSCFLRPSSFAAAFSFPSSRRSCYPAAGKSESVFQARVFVQRVSKEEAIKKSAASFLNCVHPEECKNDQSLSVSRTDNKSSVACFRLHSFSALPLVAIAALPGADTITNLFEPIADVVRSLDLPDWLVHWGHPGNMAVVLFAMGGYGSYLGWQIRLSDDMEMKTKAKDLHPKLLGGMFFFFSLGATGGILSLLTSGKPIFESPHAVTGLAGLTLLTVQTILTGFFESNPSLRGVHGVLGSGIMLLFLVHAVFGLQLGLTY